MSVCHWVDLQGSLVGSFQTHQDRDNLSKQGQVQDLAEKQGDTTVINSLDKDVWRSECSNYEAYA